jgi:hypothetical protein
MLVLWLLLYKQPYSNPQLIYLTMHTLASYSGTETNEVYMRKDDTLYKHA